MARPNYNTTARKMDVNLKSYPSKVSFSDRLEDLVKLDEKKEVSTVGRVFHSDKGMLLSYGDATTKLTCLSSVQANNFNDGDLVLVSGNYYKKEITAEKITLCSK